MSEFHSDRICSHQGNTESLNGLREKLLGFMYINSWTGNVNRLRSLSVVDVEFFHHVHGRRD